jgi:hypothetical protein
MKRLYYIATLAIALFASLPIQAQEEAGNTQQHVAVPKQAVAPVKKRRKRTACPN